MSLSLLQSLFLWLLYCLKMLIVKKVIWTIVRIVLFFFEVKKVFLLLTLAMLIKLYERAKEYDDALSQPDIKQKCHKQYDQLWDIIVKLCLNFTLVLYYSQQKIALWQWTFYSERVNRKVCLCYCTQLDCCSWVGRGWSVLTEKQHETLLCSDHASMGIFGGKDILTAHSKRR